MNPPERTTPLRHLRVAVLSALLFCGLAHAEPPWPDRVMKIEDMEMIEPLRVSVPYGRAKGDVRRPAILRVHVNKDGAVERVALLQGSGSPSHDEAALHGMRHTKFVPKEVDGTAVDVTLVVPLHFPVSKNLPAW
jgi:TonB family protein